MEIFSLSSLIILVIASGSLGQPDLVGGNSNSNLNQTPLKGPKKAAKFSSSWEPKSKPKREPEPPVNATKCPDKSTISPCSCIFYSRVVDVSCHGSEVNQTTVENTLREIRRVNQIPEDRGFVIGRFLVSDAAELTYLDLAPFYGSQLDYLEIRANAKLTKLVTSGDLEDHASIHTPSFYIGVSPLLKREGFGDTLKYLSNKMTYFDIRYLDFSDYNYSFQGEFLPGLSLHTNLTDLSFYSCNISGRVTSDTLIPKELSNLERIGLSYNKFIEIGENVYNFDDFVADGVLHISLTNVNISEASFHPNSGIARVGRKTGLYLTSNQITTLPFEIFEPFLDAHPENFIELMFNPLICDERLSWLKARRDEFQSRVRYTKCSNDPGHSIFESNLIP